jgi:hypothetical protein
MQEKKLILLIGNLLNLCVAIFLMFISSGCKNTKYIQQITGVKIVRTFPRIDEDWKIRNYDTITKNIFFYENQIMYNLCYQYNSIVNGVKDKPEERSLYFVFINGKQFGYLFDKNKKIEGTIMNVDSVLKSEFIMEAEWFTEEKQRFAKKSSTTFSKELNSLEECYFFSDPKKNNDSTIIGDFKLSFSKNIINSKFSLSKRLDSISGMKLYKYIITQYPIYYKEYDKFSDTLKIFYQMEQLKIENKQLIMDYFLRVKKLDK